MANFSTFIETPSEMQNTTFVQALDHAKNVSEDASPKASDTKAGTSKCVHFGYPTDLYDAFQSEVHKIKLLKKVLADKDKLINKRLTYTQELETRLLKEQRQTRIMRKKYENERTHSYYLSQTLSKTHEEVLSLQAQTANSDLVRDALREELHKRTDAINNLEEQNRQLIAVLTESTSRLHERVQETSHQISAECAEEVISQSVDSCEGSPSTQVTLVNPTFQNTPAAPPSTTTKPVSSILKRPTTDEPAPTTLIMSATTLITSAITWMRSHIQPTNTHQVYFHKDECDPKPSSPEFRERVKRQLNLEQMALARNYLVSLKLSGSTEDSEVNTQSSSFESRKRKQGIEEQHAFAQSPMQRLRMARME
ncbi:hypothetical protein KCU95_g16706, partial [Aureobasidium melanogenum]